MGIFSLVLHTHLPYVRRNGVWPCGEDFFHQAATESYLPLIGALEHLADAGLRDALTVGLSPMVAHQMADPYMLKELALYLGRYEIRALRQNANYRGVHEREFKALAGYFCRFAWEQGDRLDALPGGSIAAGFERLARAGVIEILGGPATHPYMPLLREPVFSRAQMRVGVREHERLFGRAPAGMWLPECAYKPDVGIEQLLDEHAIGHVVVDGPTMLRSAGPGSTFRPRRIGSSDVVTFARNLDVTYRVWSPTGGYPAGKWYRDFYHYDVVGGFKNWRVTSIKKGIDRKQPYEPERALAQARADAEDFAGLITSTLERYDSETGREGIVVAAYDTELFGHWWFEGPHFLRYLFEILQRSSSVRPMSLRAAKEALGDAEPVDLVEGTWGFRKDTRSWVSDETRYMWDVLGDVEAETVRLVEKFSDVEGARAACVRQLIREAMLMQSSDWPFMVVRGNNPDYAHERFQGHHARWSRMADFLRSRVHDELIARETDAMFAVDAALPDVSARDLLPS